MTAIQLDIAGVRDLVQTDDSGPDEISKEEPHAVGRGSGCEEPGGICHCAAALLNNGLCRYSEALTAAEKAAEYLKELDYSVLVLPELIEAASRSGHVQRAWEALRQLVQRTSESGTDWALGIEARSRALVAEDDVAELHYREAISRLGRTSVRIDLARAHLLYGEWLRRSNRRVDARKELRTAHEILTAMGSDAFSERARRELLATGETVRRRSAETRYELTAQEEQIAQLARQGHTNMEIGTELFISPRTVEWHLRKVFSKLGISSRRELRASLPSPFRAAISA
jgi:DNA-binding CsgD family transcriptional regulator